MPAAGLGLGIQLKIVQYDRIWPASRKTEEDWVLNGRPSWSLNREVLRTFRPSSEGPRNTGKAPTECQSLPRWWKEIQVRSGVPAETGCTPWLILVNQLVGGPSWVSQELTCSLRSEKNQVSGSPLAPWMRTHPEKKTTSSPVLHRAQGPLGRCSCGWSKRGRSLTIQSPGCSVWTRRCLARPLVGRHVGVTPSHRRRIKKRLGQEGSGPPSVSKMHIKLFAWPPLSPGRPREC